MMEVPARPLGLDRPSPVKSRQCSALSKGPSYPMVRLTHAPPQVILDYNLKAQRLMNQGLSVRQFQLMSLETYLR
jgi:hypothetical protein